MNTFEFFSSFLSWQSLQLKTAESSHISVTFLSRSSMHIYGIREQLCSVLPGKEALCGCGLFGGGSADIQREGHTGLLQ